MDHDASTEVTLHVPPGIGPTPLLATVIDFGERINLDLVTSERLAAGLGDVMVASGERAFDARLRLVGGSLHLQLVGDPEAELARDALRAIEDVFSQIRTTLGDGRLGLDAVIDGPG